MKEFLGVICLILLGSAAIMAIGLGLSRGEDAMQVWLPTKIKDLKVNY